MIIDCLFCKIATKALPAKLLYEDDSLIAFEDIRPQAPTHLLVVPKQHIATVNDLTHEHHALLGKMFQTATQLAKKLGFSETGYRLVMNCNPEGGQTVYHIHLHLLGGRQMTWPPG